MADARSVRYRQARSLPSFTNIRPNARSILVAVAVGSISFQGYNVIPRVSALHHVALPVTNLERSCRFYRETLGLTEIERPRAFDFPGAWFALGTGQLHLIERQGGTLRPGRPLDSRDVHFAVRVDDFDAMVAHLHSAGYRDDVPMDDLVRMKWNRAPNAGFPQIFIMDPDRHVIEINAAS